MIRNPRGNKCTENTAQLKYMETELMLILDSNDSATSLLISNRNQTKNTHITAALVISTFLCVIVIVMEKC